MLRILLLLLLSVIHSVWCFIPASIMDDIVSKAEKQTHIMGSLGETLVHEDIIKYGLLRSVAKYFHKLEPSKIDLTKLDNSYYYNTANLMFDFYGENYCHFEFEYVIEKDFKVHVAVVDFDSETKDLPYAHFDASKFRESNERVIHFIHSIHQHFQSRELHAARHLVGQVLHTIHDFYSHSNWIEMGNTDICREIGTAEFMTKYKFVADDDIDICDETRCQLVTNPCNFFTTWIYKVIKKAGFKSNTLACPIKYYKCDGNLRVLDKLVSGYYVNQKLKDGTAVDKPKNQKKCSHGGIMDGDSFTIPALGGINKDSGHYLFSPRADLHLQAADLAIKHTEFFFDMIREKYGDQQFEEFLKLDTPIGDLLQCSTSRLVPSSIVFVACAWFISFLTC